MDLPLALVLTEDGHLGWMGQVLVSIVDFILHSYSSG